uniref:Uncharacterized protein n=1 Tax=viral metagenome TaxID=1070528 RepID=A0A6C0ENG7_9ZZZZ
MGRTRKGGSRKKRGGFLEALKAAANNQAALISNDLKEAADKAKKMAMDAHRGVITNIDDAHRATIKNIDEGKVKIEQTVHDATTQAQKIASKTGATALTGNTQDVSNPLPAITGGNRRRTRRKLRKRKTHKRKHRGKHSRKRKTHRRHH